MASAEHASARQSHETVTQLSHRLGPGPTRLKSHIRAQPARPAANEEPARGRPRSLIQNASTRHWCLPNRVNEPVMADAYG